jgi:hypothetical protein
MLHAGGPVVRVKRRASACQAPPDARSSGEDRDALQGLVRLRGLTGARAPAPLLLPAQLPLYLGHQQWLAPALGLHDRSRRQQRGSGFRRPPQRPEALA